MIKKRVLTFFTFLCFFLSFQCLIAQENQETKILLSKLLPDIQKQYDVVFSFVDNTLDTVLVTPRKKTISFEYLVEFNWLNESTRQEAQTKDTRHDSQILLKYDPSFAEWHGMVLEKLNLTL